MASKRLLVCVNIQRGACKVAPFPKPPMRMTSRCSHRVRPFVSGSPATGKSFGPWLCVTAFRQLCPFQRASQASVANPRCNYSYYRIKHRNDQQTNVPLLEPNRREFRRDPVMSDPNVVDLCEVIWRALLLERRPGVGPIRPDPVPAPARPCRRQTTKRRRGLR